MECTYRKPNPGMLVFAQKKHNINMKSSILIGDKLSDIQAAKRAGLDSFYLVESGHALSSQDSLCAPVFRNLFEVAKSLESKS
jgi:D-glycero-D-manno-heptose 1,7-bisphosphate phosphatase